jgi:hypothetical protein
MSGTPHPLVCAWGLTLAPALLLACHAHPTLTPAPASTSTSPRLAPIELPASVEQGPPLVREFTLDRQRLAVAMAEQLGHDIAVLGHAELPTTHLPHREIVLFTIDGTDHCVHYLHPKQARLCDPQHTMEAFYEASGHELGLALLELADPEHPELVLMRILPDTDFGDSGDSGAEPASATLTTDGNTMETDQQLVDLDVRDVDGDGRFELVTFIDVERFEHIEYYSYECQDSPTCSFGDPNEYNGTAFRGRRIVIARDNLTLELDTLLERRGFTYFEGCNPFDPNRVEVTHTLDETGLTAQWCSIEFWLDDQFDACERAIACAEPNVRTRWVYDAERDAYLDGDENVLRPHIDYDYDFELLAPCRTTPPP